MNALPTTPRGFRWALLVSLALNVMLAALVVVPHLRTGGDGGGRFGMTRVPDPRLLRDALPRERRVVIDAAMDRHRDAIRTALVEGRRERRAFNDLLRGAQVDRAQLEAAFAALRERETATAAAVHGMLTDALTELSAEERAQVADRMHRRSGRERREQRDERAGERP